MSGLIGRGYISIAALKDGDPAKTYVLIPSVENITKKLDGTLSVTAVNCSVYKVTGSSAYALSGDHTVAYVRKPDGASGTLAHSSGTTGNVDILADTESVDFELKDGGKVIDRVRVPVLSDATDVNNELDTYKYLKESLAKQGTTIKDGLILSSLIALGYADDAGVRHTLAGMNGLYIPALGGRTIASWWGGDMIDRFDAQDNYLNEAGKRYATALVRMDGSAYFSDGNVVFKANGDAWFGGQSGLRIENGSIVMGNGIKINLSDGSEKGIVESLQSLTNFYLGMTRLLMPCDAAGIELKGGWQEAFQHDGSSDPKAIKAKSLKALVDFWGVGGITALGRGSGSGSGSGSGAIDLYIGDWTDYAEAADGGKAVSGKSGKTLYDLTTANRGNITALLARVSALEGMNFLTVEQALAAYLKIDGSNGTQAGVSALINKLAAGSDNINDNMTLVTSNSTPSASTEFYRRPFSYVWNYIKSKTDTLYALALPNLTDTTMNAVATRGNAIGMASLKGTSALIDPNGQNGWHHFINMSFVVDSSQSNMWQTQIANKAGTTDLWVRSRAGGSVSDTAAWGAPWTRILTGTNYSAVLNGVYVTLATSQAITGEKTFSARITSSKTTTTYYAGNQGQAIINSTASAGSYTMLAKMNSANGYFTHGTYQDRYELHYTAKSTVDAGTNTVTKNLTLLNEAGDSSFPGNISAASFVKSGGTSSQFLMGDGSVMTKKVLTNIGNVGWTGNAADDLIVPTMSFMAFWDGSYNGSTSNLRYCDRGRFGTIVTKNVADYVLSTAYTAADVLSKLKTVDGSGSGLDADTVDGVHLNGLLTAFSRTGVINNTLSLTVGGVTKTAALYPTGSWGMRYESKPDNGGRPVVLLIADITAWMSATSSSSVSHYGFTGRITETRTSGYMGEKITDVICRVGYNHSTNFSGALMLRTSNPEYVKPRIISYNGSYYLGLEVTSSGHGIMFEGYFYGWMQSVIALSKDASGNLPTGASDITSSYTTYDFMPYNAQSATKLLTARAINGTAFDGTGAITTALWGTAREMKITDATGANSGVAVSVNGSAAVALKLPETIAAALSGNASTATRLQGAFSLWGQSFYGNNVSGNMTGVGSISMNGNITGANSIYASGRIGGDNFKFSTRILAQPSMDRVTAAGGGASAYEGGFIFDIQAPVADGTVTSGGASHEVWASSLAILTSYHDSVRNWTPVLFLDKLNRVGINRSNPAYTLDVGGTARVMDKVILQHANGKTAEISIDENGVVHVSSDFVATGGVTALATA